MTWDPTQLVDVLLLVRWVQMPPHLMLVDLKEMIQTSDIDVKHDVFALKVKNATGCMARYGAMDCILVWQPSPIMLAQHFVRLGLYMMWVVHVMDYMMMEQQVMSNAMKKLDPPPPLGCPQG